MNKHISDYYTPGMARDAVLRGEHRAWIGGLWDEVGVLQMEFLRSRGLRRDARLLDVGCGCFRCGVHLVNYLESGHYYGIDISQELLDAGFEQEIVPRSLEAKLPRSNLLCDGGFSAARFGVTFDVGIAQSVFTHLPLNHIRLCLTRLAPVFRVGGEFFATAFILPEASNWSEDAVHGGQVRTHATEDPYHYRVDDFVFCAAGLPWAVDLIGEWAHPRGQQMLRFVRTG